MTPWQFMAAVDGYITANTSDDGHSLSKSESDDLWHLVEAKGTA